MIPRLLAGVVLVLVQMVAALPWLAALDPGLFKSLARRPLSWLVFLGTGLVLGAGFALGMFIVQDPDTLEMLGRLYASILQIQVVADLFVLVFAALLLAWPKGGAVALAAFREGVRQPMFWLLALLALFLMVLAPFVPYFTFGEDYKMVQELGFDTIMLAAVLFSCLAASMSISDEIEGRTAVTLMSKPVSRRQFLIGKFVGILLAALVLTAILGWFFDWMLLYKRWFERMDLYKRWFEETNADTQRTGLQATPPALMPFLSLWNSAGGAYDFVRGICLWVIDSGEVAAGLLLGTCKVMVLLAVAVSLATRLPMVVNLVTCLVIYLLGHLTPVLVAIADQRARASGEGATVSQMLLFMAQLFDALLPGLEFFGVGLAVVSDTPPPLLPFLWYIGSVVVYALLYTLIVLLFGLILFEDRDLA